MAGPEVALEELKSDPEIAALHRAAVAAHVARRDALLEREEYRAMRDQLRAAPLLPPQEEAMLQALGLVA